MAKLPEHFGKARCQSGRYIYMSWNLIIYKPGETPEETEALGDIGAVKEAFNASFPTLKWASATEAAIEAEGGFRLELSEEDGRVQDVYTHGGFNHIRQFAALCKREGWRMA